MKKIKQAKKVAIVTQTFGVSLLAEGARVFDSLSDMIAHHCGQTDTIWIATQEKIQLFAKCAHDLSALDFLALQTWLNAVIVSGAYAEADFGPYLEDIRAYYEAL